jgi:TonB family protein
VSNVDAAVAAHHEDTPMTSRSLQARMFLWITVVAAGAAVHAAQELSLGVGQQWQIAGLFPQSEPGPLERQAKPVTPENPIPRRTRLVRPSYPSDAAVVGARATVTLRVTIDHLGTVAEVRTVGAPVLGAMSPPSPVDERAFIAGLLALVRSTKDAVGQWLYEPPADAPIAFDVVIGFTSQADGEVVSQSAGQTSSSADIVPGPIDRGTSNVPGPRKVKHVNPIYPAAAREKKITGVVILEARIEADGRILEARVLRSIPELDDAALEAVKQWEFTPTLVNGVPTPVTMTTTIQFSLP